MATRRRLEPLRLDPRSSHEDEQQPRDAPRTAPLDVPQVAPKSRNPSLVVVLLAGTLGLAVVGAGGLVMLVFSGRKTSAGQSQSPVAPKAQAPATATSTTRRDEPWTSLLHAETCPVPCCGGAACTEKPRTCISGITCIPGECGLGLAVGEGWALHLSGITERHDTEDLDPCNTRRDLWLCLRPSSTGSWKCLSQRESCSKGGRSTDWVAVTTDDLIRNGVDVLVRSGGESGDVLVSKPGARYSSGLQRRGLCGGFKMALGKKDGPIAFTYFLDAPGRGQGP